MSNYIPDGFKEPATPSYIKAVRALASFDEGSMLEMPGFDDVIGERFLGSGLYSNTCGIVNQLCGAIALSEHPLIPEVFALGRSVDLEEASSRVKRLRSEQVLDGMRILDLGCGVVPYFAAAARSLGATTYTADAEERGERFPQLGDTHVKIDFRQPEAVDAIRDVTGDSLDLVTEQIIAPLPSQYYLAPPSYLSILDIARPILRKGGILSALTYGLSVRGYERT